MGHMLLDGVEEWEEWPRARQQLAQVRLPLLRGPGMPKLFEHSGWSLHGSCELHIALHGAGGQACVHVSWEQSVCLEPSSVARLDSARWSSSRHHDVFHAFWTHCCR